MRKTPAIVLLPLAFIVGGLVGAYGPMEELRARNERAESAKADAKAKAKASGAFGSFAQIINIPDEARRVRSPRKLGKPDNAEPKGVQESQGASVQVRADANEASAKSAVERRKLSPEDLKARIDEAADLWRTRIELARTAAVSKLGLDDDGCAAFDGAVAAMNEKLRESMQIVADQIASVDELTPELGVRLMGDVSASLAEAYDAIGACVAEGRRGDVSKLNIADFIDPSVAEPFVAVQDKLERTK